MPPVIHDLSRRYFYYISGDESVPGTLSYLLSVKESDLVEIFKVCGFHNKKGSFQKAGFKMWANANFERGSLCKYALICSNNRFNFSEQQRGGSDTLRTRVAYTFEAS
jgi:hypothetical protein